MKNEILDAVNPASQQIFEHVESTPKSKLPKMVEKAAQAQKKWAALTYKERGIYLKKLKNLVIERAEEIAETISKGMGKPLVESYLFGVNLVAEDLEEYSEKAGIYLADEDVPTPEYLGENKKALVRYTPRGVVAVIAPWNFPFGLAMSPVITALAAGNSVVLKPTSAVPMIGKVIEKLFNDTFSDFDGLAQVVHGKGSLGSDLATTKGIDFVAFTGSTQIGRQLQKQLAENLTPSLLELGGSDPLIVTDDANLIRAAKATVFGRFSNNGQICEAVKRVYVNEKVADAFIANVKKEVEVLTSGEYTTPANDVGPLANGRGVNTMREQLQDALDKGAELIAGGFPENDDTLFWPATVLTNVNHSMRVMHEEVFGPILPIQIVKDDEEAIALANDSEYGLDAYVFSSNMERAHKIANQLQAGSVDINEVLVHYAVSGIPFGGVKNSGINRYHGKIGLQLFANYKGMVIDSGEKDTEALWFPYSEEKLQGAKQLLEQLK